MQEVFSEKCKVEIIVSSETVFYIECNPSEVEYPQSFLDIARFWKHLVMKEGTELQESVFCGTALGGALVLACCLWCRDHGIPLPSGIMLQDPVLSPVQGKATGYFAGADVDDPCALPLIADYYGFPEILVSIHENSPVRDQAEDLCRKLLEQGINLKRSDIK